MYHRHKLLDLNLTDLTYRIVGRIRTSIAWKRLTTQFRNSVG
jgi:hypothetical protein